MDAGALLFGLPIWLLATGIAMRSRGRGARSMATSVAAVSPAQAQQVAV